MNEAMIVSLIALLGSLAGAVLSTFSNIRVAQIQAGRQTGQSDDKVAYVRTVLASSRAKTLWIGIFFAVVIGLIAGSLTRDLLSRVEEDLRKQVLADFGSFQEIASFAVTQVPDTLDVRPWVVAKGTNAELLKEKVPGRGTDGALRIRATLSPGPEGRLEAGVRLNREDLPPGPINLIVAWVYVKESESAAAADLKAYLNANTENKQGAFVVTQGSKVKLSLGTWVPVIWARTGSTYFWESGQARTAGTQECTFKEEGAHLTSVELRFLADAEPYPGSLYVDDVRFYRLR